MSAADKKVKKKTCFVISPIGEKGSEERRKADLFLNLIVKETLEKEPFNYQVLRADEIKESTMITDQVINHCLESDLIIADLTDRNANAYYELAIAHMAEKAVITMIEANQQIPFDNSQFRTIHYRTDDFDTLAIARNDLAEHVKTTEKSGFIVSNPVTSSRKYKSLKESSDTSDQLLANLIEQMKYLQLKVNKLDSYQGSFDAVNSPKHTEVSVPVSTISAANFLRVPSVSTVSSFGILGGTSPHMEANSAKSVAEKNKKRP